ncbi:hypothetical protein NFI96_018091, partial [Prochilodus magdalenae]
YLIYRKLVFKRNAFSYKNLLDHNSQKGVPRLTYVAVTGVLCFYRVEQNCISVIKKFKTHGTVANFPRCGRKRKIDERFQRKMVRMVDKEPRLTSKQVQAACMSGYHSYGKEARLEFCQKNIPEAKTFLEECSSGQMRQKSQHGGGSLKFGGLLCLASGTGLLDRVHGIMKSELYVCMCRGNGGGRSGPWPLSAYNIWLRVREHFRKRTSTVYQNSVRPFVCNLKLKQTWVLQQDNDPKHTSKSTSE